MKKLLILILGFFLFTSCFNRITLDKTGTLVLAVKFPNEQVVSTNKSRAISTSTSSIEIVIHQVGKPETSQSKTITHNSSDSKHEIEFNELVEGNWHLVITFKDTNSNVITVYEDLIKITSEEPTVVQTAVGGLRKITEAYSDPMYPEMYIPDGATGVMSGNFGIVYLGNLYTSPEVLYDEAYVTFLLSDNEEFSSVQTYVYPYPVQKGYLVISQFNNVVGDGFLPNTKYYWKAIVVSESFGTEQMIETNVFTFTTGELIQGP